MVQIKKKIGSKMSSISGRLRPKKFSAKRKAADKVPSATLPASQPPTASSETKDLVVTKVEEQLHDIEDKHDLDATLNPSEENEERDAAPDVERTSPQKDDVPIEEEVEREERAPHEEEESAPQEDDDASMEGKLNGENIPDDKELQKKDTAPKESEEHSQMEVEKPPEEEKDEDEGSNEEKKTEDEAMVDVLVEKMPAAPSAPAISAPAFINGKLDTVSDKVQSELKTIDEERALTMDDKSGEEENEKQSASEVKPRQAETVVNEDAPQTGYTDYLCGCLNPFLEK